MKDSRDTRLKGTSCSDPLLNTRVVTMKDSRDTRLKDTSIKVTDELTSLVTMKDSRDTRLKELWLDKVRFFHFPLQ